MKVLIFSPYLNSLGGGERYIFSISEFFLKRKDKIYLAWDREEIKDEVKKRFNLDISPVVIANNAYKLLKSQANFFEKYKLTSSYDLIFFVSDGSVPLLFGKKNYLHFQVPFKDVNGLSFTNQLKLKLITGVICNSFFTKKVIDQEYKVNSQVLYPPLSNDFNPDKNKENIILSVGRFDNILHSKKQDVMIKVFKELIDKKKLKDWKLVLLGGLLGERTYFNNLQKTIKNYPIIIKENVDFKTLKQFYSQAKIYWHMAGFGEDLVKYPERAEHFGISVLEAMASGCLPIVFSGGGLPEIVTNGKDGFLFDNLSKLCTITLEVIKNQQLQEKISREAIRKVKAFSKNKFFEKINELID